MQTITLADANDFIVRVTLDNTIYRLHFAWNDTAGFWVLGIRDEKDTVLVAGIRCVPNYPLLIQYRKPVLPKGELLCITMDDAQISIGRDDFTTGKVKLVYVPESELYGAI